MFRSSFLRVYALAVITAIAAADYDILAFPGNATTNLCPRMIYACVPPSICAHDPIRDKYYCCNPGSKDGKCWVGAAGTNCNGANGTPDGSQISCSSGSNLFCCLKNSEECTQTRDQIRICWATDSNPVANFSTSFMNSTYSSLRAASPSATAYTVNLNALSSAVAPSSSSSSSSSSSTTATVHSTTSSAPTSTPTNNGHDGLSGGAIGGIVGGVVGGLAVLGLLGFFLWRRRRASKLPATESHGVDTAYGGAAGGYPHGNPEGAHESSFLMTEHRMPTETGIAEAPVTEKYAGYKQPHNTPAYQHPPVELHGVGNAYEMDGSGNAGR